MKRALGLLIALALPLAACGSDDDSADSTAASTATTATTGGASTTADAPPTSTGDAGPATSDGAASAGGEYATTAADGSITITHSRGTTTLDERPERIVSLDVQWTDVLAALDAPLVGVPNDPLMADRGGVYPWQDDVLPADAASVPLDASTLELPMEAIAALRPDLIVLTWQAQDQAAYEQLSAIAPTIPMLSDRDVELWPDIAAVAGELIGDPAAAQELVDETRAEIDARAAELPGLAGKTYAFANYVPGAAITILADPDDGAAQMFAEFGLAIDPDLLAIADGATGRVDISLEDIGELDADLLLMLTNGADTSEIAGYDALPAVQRGAATTVDMAVAVALNTPSPVSLLWALDTITPALEAAAA